MSEKRSFNVSAEETPDFLKTSRPEKEPGFVRLTDVIEGFKGRAKISEQIWRVMFPQGLPTKERLSRLRMLKQVVEERPDAVLEDVSDLLLLGIPVSESDAHFVNEAKPYSPVYRPKRVDRSDNLSDDNPTRVLSALADPSQFDGAVDDLSVDIPLEELDGRDGAGTRNGDIPMQYPHEESGDAQLAAAILKARGDVFRGELRSRFAPGHVGDKPQAFHLEEQKSPFPPIKEESGSRTVERAPKEDSHLFDRAQIAGLAQHIAETRIKRSPKRPSSSRT